MTQSSILSEKTAWWIVACALALVWVQTGRLRSAHDEIGLQAGATTETLAALRARDIEVGALLERLNLVRTSGPAIVGAGATEVAPPVELELSESVLIYVIATACGKCPANFPFLQQIEQARPGAVVAVSLADSPEVLREYAQRHGLSFAVVSLVGGWLRQALPRHGTPITLLLRDGAMTDMATGLLSPEVARRFALQVVGPQP